MVRRGADTGADARPRRGRRIADGAHMNAVPYVGARALAPLARRTAVIRALLVVALVAIVVAAALAVRHPHPTESPYLPPSAGGVVVLDLSASITSDTYSRIHNTLRQLVARGGRYGLVVF